MIPREQGDGSYYQGYRPPREEEKPKQPANTYNGQEIVAVIPGEEGRQDAVVYSIPEEQRVTGAGPVNTISVPDPMGNRDAFGNIIPTSMYANSSIKPSGVSPVPDQDTINAIVRSSTLPSNIDAGRLTNQAVATADVFVDSSGHIYGWNDEAAAYNRPLDAQPGVVSDIKNRYGSASLFNYTQAVYGSAADPLGWNTFAREMNAKYGAGTYNYLDYGVVKPYEFDTMYGKRPIGGGSVPSISVLDQARSQQVPGGLPTSGVYSESAQGSVGRPFATTNVFGQIASDAPYAPQASVSSVGGGGLMFMSVAGSGNMSVFPNVFGPGGQIESDAPYRMSGRQSDGSYVVDLQNPTSDPVSKAIGDFALWGSPPVTIAAGAILGGLGKVGGIVAERTGASRVVSGVGELPIVRNVISGFQGLYSYGQRSPGDVLTGIDRGLPSGGTGIPNTFGYKKIPAQKTVLMEAEGETPIIDMSKMGQNTGFKDVMKNQPVNSQIGYRIAARDLQAEEMSLYAQAGPRYSGPDPFAPTNTDYITRRIAARDLQAKEMLSNARNGPRYSGPDPFAPAASDYIYSRLAFQGQALVDIGGMAAMSLTTDYNRENRQSSGLRYAPTGILKPARSEEQDNYNRYVPFSGTYTPEPFQYTPPKPFQYTPPKPDYDLFIPPIPAGISGFGGTSGKPQYSRPSGSVFIPYILDFNMPKSFTARSGKFGKAYEHEVKNPFLALAPMAKKKSKAKTKAKGKRR